MGRISKGKPVKFLNHREFLDSLRSCCTATVAAVNRDTKKAAKFEERRYKAICRQVLGRKLTQEELDHVCGGNELPPEDKEKDTDE